MRRRLPTAKTTLHPAHASGRQKNSLTPQSRLDDPNNLPDDLIARAKAYAARHGTSVTAIIREHLEAITRDEHRADPGDHLLAYSRGELSRQDAIRLLGFRDYTELLVALGDAGLPMPAPPRHEVENQAAMFERIWRAS